MQKSPLLIFFAAALTPLLGCASGTMGRLADSSELPKEISQDLQKRYEVKDVPPQPAPSIAPEFLPATPPMSKAEERKAAKALRKKKSARHIPPASVETPAVYVYPDRRPTKDPLWLGEQEVYDITYFGVSAGEFTTDILPYKEIDGRKVYHVRGLAETSNVFSLFYKLHDTVETYIDFESLFSHRFHVVLDETKQTRDSLEIYDPLKAQTYYWNRWNHKERGYSETKEFSGIAPLSQDSLSALYFIRANSLKDGTVISFPVVSEGKSWEAVISVVGHEIMQTPMGRVACVIVKPETKYQGNLEKKGDSFIWLTDDDRHIVVRLEAKVKVGTVVATLKRYNPGTPPTP